MKKIMLMMGLVVVTGIKAVTPFGTKSAISAEKNSHICTMLPTLPSQEAGQIAECLLYVMLQKVSAHQIVSNKKLVSEQPEPHFKGPLAGVAQHIFTTYKKYALKGMNEELELMMKIVLPYIFNQLAARGISEKCMENMDNNNAHYCQKCVETTVAAFMKNKQSGNDLGILPIADESAEGKA